MSERRASIAATSSSRVPTRGATDGGSAGCGTVDAGAGLPPGRAAHSGGCHEPVGAGSIGAGAFGSAGAGACAGAWALGAGHAVDAIQDCDESAATGACGAAASAVHADVRTGAAWLTGSGATGACATGAGSSGAFSSPFLRPKRPQRRRPLSSPVPACTRSPKLASGAAAVGAHVGAAT